MAKLEITGTLTTSTLDPVLTIQLFLPERRILLQEHSIVNIARRNAENYKVVFFQIPAATTYIIRYILKDRSTGEIIQRFTRAART